MSDTYTADTTAVDEAAPAPVADDASSEPKKYGGDLHGIQEAAADHQRDLDEKKKAAPSPDRIAKAKEKLSERVAERMGAETVDLDMITWNDKEDKNLAPLKAAKGLAEFRRQKEAGLQEILREDDAAAEAELESAKQEAEWTAQIEQETQRQAAEEQRQRQQAAAQEQRELSETEYALRSRLQQYEAAALAELPELPQLLQLAQTNPAQAQQLWAAFAAQNPAKAAKIQQLHSAAQADAVQAELAASKRQQQDWQQRQVWSAAQEDAFLKAHPELLSDRKAKWEWKEDVGDYLAEKFKVPEAQLGQVWHSYNAQERTALYDAAKAYRTEKMRKEIRPTQPPQPQRPGVSTGRVGMNGTSGENTLRAIDAAPTLRKQLAAATEATLARRRAAAKGRR